MCVCVCVCGGGGGPSPTDLKKSYDVVFFILFFLQILSLFCRGSPVIMAF